MVETIERKILQNTLRNPDLHLRPDEVREIFTDNYYRRGISLLEGWSETEARLLRCTKSGILKVATTGGGFEEYVVETGMGSDSYTTDNTYLYDIQYNRWDLLLEDYDAIISFRNKTNTDWLEDMILTAGWHSLDFVSYGIRIKNRISGQNVTYQIVAYR